MKNKAVCNIKFKGDQYVFNKLIEADAYSIYVSMAYFCGLLRTTNEGLPWQSSG